MPPPDPNSLCPNPTTPPPDPNSLQPTAMLWPTAMSFSGQPALGHSRPARRERKQASFPLSSAGETRLGVSGSLPPSTAATVLVLQLLEFRFFHHASGSLPPSTAAAVLVLQLLEFRFFHHASGSFPPSKPQFFALVSFNTPSEFRILHHAKQASSLRLVSAKQASVAKQACFPVRLRNRRNNPGCLRQASLSGETSLGALAANRPLTPPRDR